MPILMEPSSHSNSSVGMQYVASEDDDYNASIDDDEDYSFSLSGLPEEDNDANPDFLSKALEDSLSFSFSIENPFYTECGMFGFKESSPIVSYTHTEAFKSSSPCTIMTHHDEHEESASLVPFKITGSWCPESSLRHYSRHAESRRSFSFLTDMVHGTEHSEEIVMHINSSTIGKDSEPNSGGNDVAGVIDKHDVKDEDNDKHGYTRSHQGVLDDQEKQGHDDHGNDDHEKQGHDDHGNDDNNICTYNGNNKSGHDDRDVLSKHAPHDRGKYANAKRVFSGNNNVCAHSGNIESGHDDKDALNKHAPHDYGKYAHHHEHAKKSFSVDLTADSIMRFAGEGLLQPWSSSKLSKSCGHNIKRQIHNSQDRIHSSHVSLRSMNYMHPFLSHPSDIKNDFGIKAIGMQPSNRMVESEPFSPRGTSFIKGVGSPTHTPLYMTTTRRKSSGLFARRVQNSGETLSLLVNAQRFSEAALSPPSKGSTYCNSYRTSSVGSTQSSGYSSSSCKSSTPTSRHLSRNVSLVDARCSLHQRMDEEPHKQEDPNAQIHRKGDPSCPLHRKGDPKVFLHRTINPSGNVYKEGDSCKCMQAQGESKAKTNPFGVGHGLMSPSTPPTPRSPLSWRSVLSLQPLNPSHVPLDEWEILGKPNSRSQSQRSRSSSRGSSREGRRSSVISPEFLGLSNGSNKKNSKKEDMKPNTKQLVKRNKRYWGLNLMQWFRQCRNDKQVVVDTGNLDS